MKTAKLGAIFLISLMALAGVGAGYAAWTDTITITGTVNTGNVDLVVVGYSGTWVYKDLLNDDLVESPVPIDDENLRLVAHSQAYEGAEDDEVIFKFNNLFPCVWFKADVVLHYMGTVPVKVNSITYSFLGDQGDWITPLINLGHIRAIVERAIPDGYGGWIPTGEIVEEGTQLHFCDHIIIELWIHIPQDWPDGTPTNDLMLRSGTGQANIEVIQWNEYGPG